MVVNNYKYIEYQIIYYINTLMHCSDIVKFYIKNYLTRVRLLNSLM